MTVEVIKLQGGGAVGDTFSYFADNFNRADQPWMVGTNWNTSIDAAENIGVTGVQLAGLWNIGGGTDLVLANNAGPAPCPTLVSVPQRINPTPLWGGKQFAELQFISWTNAVDTVGAGPAVFMDENSFSAYVVDALNNGVAGHYRVERWVNGVITAVIIAFKPFAVNDTLRIEVVPGAPHTISIFKNGVLDATVTDAGIAAVGVPCIVGSAITGGNNMHFRNFKCGSLPQIRNDANFNQ